MSRVSVLIAARDHGHFLADALHSVQAQSFVEWECLVVDDGSRDRTPEVVRPFLADARFRYIHSDALGQPRAKNLALRLSRAPLIAYLDGDDVWLPTKLARQVRMMAADSRLGVCFTRRSLMDSSGKLLPTPKLALPRGRVFNEMLLNNFVCFSSVLVRRQVLEHVGAFDPRLELAIDYDLWLRVAEHYAFDFIDEALVKYRVGHDNLSKRIVDRIASVFSTMRRCLRRRRNDETTPEIVKRQAWGSTCRSMGYVLRDNNPLRALGWYCRAGTHDRNWRATLRAILRGLRRTLVKKEDREIRSAERPIASIREPAAQARE